MSHAHNVHVLIVDDERIIADTLKMILDNRGYDAHATYSGEQAVESARSLSPNVLISDVIMDGISGIEAAIQISATLPDCRIILISGHGGAADMMEGLGDLVHDFQLLPKPVHPQILLDLLNAPPELATLAF